MNRYTRVIATPGKSYMCGCDLQRDKLDDGAHWSDPNYVTRDTCRQHGVPVEPQPVGPSISELVRAGVLSRHAYNLAHPVHCECNRAEALTTFESFMAPLVIVQFAVVDTVAGRVLSPAKLRHASLDTDAAVS